MLLVLDRQCVHLIPARRLNCVMVAHPLLLSILFHLSESSLVDTLYQLRSHGENGILIVESYCIVIRHQIRLLTLLLDWDLIYDFT